jgi:Fe-S cluster assembly ATP-binding protein
MGPNGTGKSTLAKAVAGHPDCAVESGEALLDGVNLIGMEPDAIARAGLFMAFQYPMEIPGVSIANLSYRPRSWTCSSMGILERRHPQQSSSIEECDESEDTRPRIHASLGQRGSSGGEKKRCEVLLWRFSIPPTPSCGRDPSSGHDIDALAQRWVPWRAAMRGQRGQGSIDAATSDHCTISNPTSSTSCTAGGS